MRFCSARCTLMGWLLLLGLACTPPPDDRQPPQTIFEATPAEFLAAGSAEFIFRASIPDSTFECSLDELSFSECTSPHTERDLGERSHVFAVRARRGEAVDETPATHAFTVDLTTPETTLSNYPSPFARSPAATFAFTSNEPDSTFRCRLDDEAEVACTSPRSVNGLAEGAHRFTVAAVDPAGNSDATPYIYSWSVDLAPPETMLTGVPEATTDELSAIFEFSSDESAARFDCVLDGVAHAGCASPWVTPLLASGSHTFEVRAVDRAGNADATAETHTWVITPGTITLRAMAANISSGTQQSYDPGEGIRIFQAFAPDVVMIQEFKFKNGTEADLREFVDTAFGAEFVWAREPATLGSAIPNGVISRYPILASGVWDDPLTTNREFVWARIDLPGAKDLWAVSVHLLTSNASERSEEASALVEYVRQYVPTGDFLLVGGDLNTRSRTESALDVLGAIIVRAGANSWPADQNGNDATSTNRAEPYDWLLADTDLNPLRTAVVVGSSSYPNGLVFDSRVYTPLSEVAPVLSGDSAAEGMQHMPVIRDFRIAY